MSETPREALLERMAKGMYEAVPAAKTWEGADDEVKARFRRHAEAALEAASWGQAIERLPFRIQTPREGLLTIVAELNGGNAEAPARVLGRIREHAAEGLTGHEDYRTSDALADRLAQAHAVLKKVDREGFPDDCELEGEVAEALSLPPDLESMIERRMH